MSEGVTKTDFWSVDNSGCLLLGAQCRKNSSADCCPMLRAPTVVRLKC